MNGLKPYSLSGQQRLPTSSPERRVGQACSALPSPRLRGRSRSRRPGALADRFGAAKARPSPAGRGRNVRRAAKNRTRLMIRNGFGYCSLSHRERVRVRGNHRNSDPAYRTSPGTVELRGSSGRAGGFPGSLCCARTRRRERRHCDGYRHRCRHRVAAKQCRDLSFCCHGGGRNRIP